LNNICLNTHVYNFMYLAILDAHLYDDYHKLQ
jgi:hypothetical protein